MRAYSVLAGLAAAVLAAGPGAPTADLVVVGALFALTAASTVALTAWIREDRDPRPRAVEHRDGRTPLLSRSARSLRTRPSRQRIGLALGTPLPLRT